MTGSILLDRLVGPLRTKMPFLGVVSTVAPPGFGSTTRDRPSAPTVFPAADQIPALPEVSDQIHHRGIFGIDRW